jgi:predicted DNA-binding transcriptional regulator YafY
VSQTERIYQIHRLLRGRRPPSMEALIERLEVNRSSVKRDIAYMRDRLHAPVIYDKDTNSYRYECAPGEAPYELLGVWFTADELHALIVMQDLLDQLQSGLLGEPLRPLQRKLDTLIEKGVQRRRELRKRILILESRKRRVKVEHFQAISSATLERRRIELTYYGRAKAEESQRVVSPQRLIYYNSNWYLDAWCHLREDLRSFALDSIRAARVTEERARDIDAAQIEAHLGAGYGIYAGAADSTAVLRFRADAARWVAKEVWHTDQRAALLPDGSLRLEVPYAHPREIVMDVLRHGAAVEVEAPGALRRAVAEAHREAAEQYGAIRRSPGSVASTGD